MARSHSIYIVWIPTHVPYKAPPDGMGKPFACFTVKHECAKWCRKHYTDLGPNILDQDHVLQYGDGLYQTQEPIDLGTVREFLINNPAK